LRLARGDRAFVLVPARGVPRQARLVRRDREVPHDAAGRRRLLEPQRARHLLGGARALTDRVADRRAGGEVSVAAAPPPPGVRPSGSLRYARAGRGILAADETAVSSLTAWPTRS